ncbi:hypothetical protein H2200_009701 [Cladophialophora chaetospira]|uniref:Uncharacterized protein n=1 Tax=Cladophialophora chaetospira TaxID=386627 RepID=A0AA38X395_9EURO|nr:hypothetical protein H2200_009701 [Cladophialophora chaetospira]
MSFRSRSSTPEPVSSPLDFKAAEQSHTMESALIPGRTTFEDLPNDCILLIVKEVAKLPKQGWNEPLPVKKLSVVNKRLRQLCIPLIFHSNKTSLYNYHLSIVQTFEVASNAPSVMSRLFAVEISLYERHDATSSYDNAFCASFVSTLTAMTSLSQLSLSLHNNEILVPMLRTSFENSDAAFPSVQVLVLSEAPNTPFILKACPSLKTFIGRNLTKKWKSTISPLPSMNTLRQVEIDGSENWTPRRLQELVPYVVKIPELCIKGELYRAKLSSFASCFENLRNLNTLAITSTQWVNVRHLERYHMDDRLLDEVDHQQETHYLNEDDATVARTFFTTCSSLTTFRPLFAFRGTRIVCERHEAGVDQGKIKNIRVCKEDDKEYWYGFSSKFSLFGGDD